MNISERWPVFRLPGATRGDVVEEERLLKLFWNRAELKKELQALDDELHSLQGRIRQQEAANSRLQEQLEELEVLLGSAEQGPSALVHFALRNLWRECRNQLSDFAVELRRQRQDHERKRQLAEFQNDRKERLKLAEERLAEAVAVVEMERARLVEGEQRITALRAFWHYFRRRELRFELEAQRVRVADAERQLEDLKQAGRTIEKEPWPEFPGLSVGGRRAINLAVIAYAQLLCSRLAESGLARQARLATHRRVQDQRFGNRDECLARLGAIAKAIAVVRSQDGVAAQIRTLTEKLKAGAAWRGSEEVVPVPSSMQAADASPDSINVLIDDYWDIYKVLLR